MSDIKSRGMFDEIVAFSGVERYIDTPVKRYSSGMYVRLAFAVAAHQEQQDAQEFLQFIVDQAHEDVRKLRIIAGIADPKVLYSALLFLPKYRLDHPEYCLFSLSEKIVVGSNYPKQYFILF